MEREQLKQRLDNWKFMSALRYIQALPEENHYVVRALAVIWGDTGHCAGGAQIGIMIDYIVERLLAELK